MFRVKYEKTNSSKKTISKGNQIVLVLHGESLSKFDNYQLSLKQGDLFYLPESVAYEGAVKSEFDALKIYLPDECREQLKPWNTNFLNINFATNHKLIAKFLKDYQDVPNFDSIKASTELIEHLKFQKLNPQVNAIKDERIIAVCDYIQQNFERRITASEVAEKIGMNAAYLTTLFKNEIGVPITKYINYIRLEAALVEIYYTQYSFTRIAYSNGFADVRTLNAMIKERFGVTPSEIRERIKKEVYNHNKYIIVDKYIQKYYQNIEIENANIERTIDIDIKAKSQGPLNNNFNCFAIGRAFDVLDAEVQRQIMIAAKELKFDYCRFHNIFGDEMNCINVTDTNQLQFNFTNVIKIFDFLLSQGIKPFVELGFFPNQICNQVEGPFTGYRINVGGEINYQLWATFLTDFGHVIINRYGQEVISTWRFEVFNEPDLEAFWSNSISEYIKLYKLTYDTLKAVNLSFKIGGFGVSNFSVTNDAVFELNRALYNKEIKVDFISIHSYPFEVIEYVDYRKLLSNNGVDLTYAPNKLRADIKRGLDYTKDIGVNELFITEWNTTVHHRESLNDDLYKGSSIVREFIRIADQKLSGICCWTLSDVVYELGLMAEEFHGGMGMITKNGIKKCGYHGFALTNKMKGQIIACDYNYLVTKTNDEIFVLIHNNANLKRDYGNKMGSDVIKQVDTKPINFTVKISNLKADYYHIESYLLSEAANPKRLAEVMDVNQYLSLDTIEYIAEHSAIKPQINLKYLTSESDHNLEIQNNEVVLISIKNIPKK